MPWNLYTLLDGIGKREEILSIPSSAEEFPVRMVIIMYLNSCWTWENCHLKGKENKKPRKLCKRTLYMHKGHAPVPLFCFSRKLLTSNYFSIFPFFFWFSLPFKKCLRYDESLTSCTMGESFSLSLFFFTLYAKIWGFRITPVICLSILTSAQQRFSRVALVTFRAPVFPLLLQASTHPHSPKTYIIVLIIKEHHNDLGCS